MEIHRLYSGNGTEGHLPEQRELSIQIEKLRQLCSDLDKALGDADRQRELIAKMKLDAAAVYKALTTKV